MVLAARLKRLYIRLDSGDATCISQEFVATDVKGNPTTAPQFTAELTLRKATKSSYTTQLTTLEWSEGDVFVGESETLTTRFPITKKLMLHDHNNRDRWRLTNGEWKLVSITTISEATRVRRLTLK